MSLKKNILILILILLVVTIFGGASAKAQGVDAEHLKKDSSTSEEDLRVEDEAPPPAEAPYPNAKTEEVAPKPEASPAPQQRARAPRTQTTIQQNSNPNPGGVLGVPHAVPSTAPQAPMTIERPRRVNDDGEYIYDKSMDLDETDVSRVPAPPQKAVGDRLKVTQPIKIRKDGEYYYGYDKPPHNQSASIKVGFFPPPNLQNKDNGNNYKTLYGNTVTPTAMFDYEKEFHRSYGDLGLRIGSGVFYQGKGSGRFRDSTTYRKDGFVPDVNFSMIILPTTLTGLYHFRYSDTQIFTPYVGAGAGLFVFGELRDDNIAPRAGGAAVAVGLGGINIMIDGVDAAASRQLENDYGVSHVSFNIEFTQYLGLNSYYDFTDSVINFGFNLEF